MNAYANFHNMQDRDISMQDLPDPLTQADQTSFPWLKLPHIECLIDADINALSIEAQGVLFRLICHSGRQYPYGSLPDDMRHLINMAGLKLPAPDSPAYLKKLAKAETVIRSVLDAAFIYCRDERYYCPLLTDLLPAPVSAPVSAPATGQDPAASFSGASDSDAVVQPGKTQSAGAIRTARSRENKRLKKLAESGVTVQNVTGNTDVTGKNVTCNAAVTPDVTPTVTGVTPVTPDVTPVTGQSVTNEGGLGGDLDLDPDLDLDSASKKNNPADGVGQQQPGPDYFQTTDLGWTPRLGLLNARLQMAGHKPVTDQVLLQTLVTFNPHYDDKPVMSDNNRLGRLVDWIGDKQQKAARQLQIKPSGNKPDPNTTYYGISKDDIQKYARTGETEFDCAKRIFTERQQGNVSPAAKLPTTWSTGNKNALRLIQQFDPTVTQDSIDALASKQGKDRDDVLAVLYNSLAIKQRDQAIADAKAGQS